MILEYWFGNRYNTCTPAIWHGIGYVSSSLQCSACSASEYIDVNGQCVACSDTCGGASCQIDTAVAGGTPTQSSLYSATQFPATIARIFGNENGFTHTAGAGQANPWWQLQLDATEAVSSVTVAFRRGACMWGTDFVNGPFWCWFSLYHIFFDTAHRTCWQHALDIPTLAIPAFDCWEGHTRCTLAILLVYRCRLESASHCCSWEMEYCKE